ncbi:MAG TPA: MmgE/PrpD family protein, partial [Candidatus Sulfotelmatobacter sp.]|nr:MmgE/PrpD family protein [Candidatus Sulfotelmatobacter sp.]
DRILAAIIAGYELMTRLGEAIDPARQYAYGFHPTATCGVFGAACAAGLLLGADPPSLRRALGLAGTGASGTLSYLNDGAPTKPIQVGNAVAYGVMAALLNAGGVPGPSTVFGGRYGFYQTYARGGDADRLVAGLGSDPLGLAQTGIKSLACCGYIQPDVALALELARRERVAPSDIQAIRAGVVSTAVPIVGEPRALKMRPQTVVDVQFSLPYCMAAALTYGQLMPADVVRSLSDEQLTGLAGRVTLTADPALDDRYPAHWGGWVELALRDGRRLFAETIDCKGHPGNLLSDEQLRAKLASLTSPAMASAILEVAADFPDQTAAELFGRLGRKALAPA